MNRASRLLAIIVAVCILAGCGCNRRPSDRQASQLIRAIEAGDRALADRLLAERIDVNGQDRTGMTPLLQSLLSGNEQLYRQLLARGANPNVCNTKGQCVMNVAADRAGPWLELALKHSGDPNALNVGNRFYPNSTPLFYTMHNQHLDIETWHARNVDLLIKAGANVNHQDSRGQSPLTVAAETESYESVVLLLLAGADPTLPEKNGLTTVDWFDERTEDMVLSDAQKPYFRKAREMLIERGLLNPDGSKRRR